MSKISKLIRALEVIQLDAHGKYSVFKKGYSLSSIKVVSGLRRFCGDVNTVIDVGANIGQFTVASANQFKGASIYSFEPVPDAFDKLRQNLAGCENVKVYNIALGKQGGEIDFFRNEYTQVSSALKILTSNKNPNYDQGKSKQIKVRVVRLDDINLDLGLVHNVLLKIDVQGMEEEVLLGGANTIKQVDYLVLEVPFEALYENQPTFDEIHSFVKGIGFSLLGPVGYNEGCDHRIIESDMLYKKV